MFYVYIIESIPSGRWYYGSSRDPELRLKYHNKGWNRSTRGRGRWKLIFLREFQTEEAARHFEFHLKHLRNKQYILRHFRDHFLKSGPPGLPR